MHPAIAFQRESLIGSPPEFLEPFRGRIHEFIKASPAPVAQTIAQHIPQSLYRVELRAIWWLTQNDHIFRHSGIIIFWMKSRAILNHNVDRIRVSTTNLL